MSSMNDVERHTTRQLFLFDKAFPVEERLPLRFCVEFKEIVDGQVPAVVVTQNGRQIGDQLTDNSYVEDGYRYHDVFHFANAAILGWSPMTRKLLDCKRKSNPKVAVVEDGGRAKVIEEVVCALIYDYGLQHGFELGETDIEVEFIHTLRRITSDREVSQRDENSWRRLINASLGVWRSVWKHRGGILEGDLRAGQIKFTPYPDENAATPS